MTKKLEISVGIMAFNEGQNIANLLDTLKNQILKTVSIKEILVISSGSTDNTNKIVREYAKSHKKIRLIIQKTRKGKSSAVNVFLKHATSNLVLLLSADLLLEPNTLELMGRHFNKSQIGIVGAHPIPVNDKNNLMGFTAHFLWELHHQISLKKPKMGEMILFRKIFQQIPILSAVDEANIEPLIRGQGYKALYEPKAVVRNKSPETIVEFISVRRRVYCGHIVAKNEYSYEVSTYNNLKIMFLILKNFQCSWEYLVYVPIIVSLEAYCRVLGYLDYRFKLKNHTIWEITPSTKELKIKK